jgi:uncharacterized damage-inducible protein DinB
MTVEESASVWSSTILAELWGENVAVRVALTSEVRGLSDAQLGFRTTPGRWSIGEILDHLCLAERSITKPRAWARSGNPGLWTSHRNSLTSRPTIARRRPPSP